MFCTFDDIIIIITYNYIAFSKIQLIRNESKMLQQTNESTLQVVLQFESNAQIIYEQNIKLNISLVQENKIL